MGAFNRYEDVSVGDLFPSDPLPFVVAPRMVDTFLTATQDPKADVGPAKEGDAAPSMVAAVYLIDLLKARGSPPGGIHAKQSIRFFRAPIVGEALTLQATVVEKYLRKERPYVISDFETRDSDGALVSSGRITSIWGKDT